MGFASLFHPAHRQNHPHHEAESAVWFLIVVLLAITCFAALTLLSKVSGQ